MEMIAVMMMANFQLLKNNKKFLQEPNCAPSLRVQLSHRWKGDNDDNDDNDDDDDDVFMIMIWTIIAHIMIAKNYRTVAKVMCGSEDPEQISRKDEQ